MLNDFGPSLKFYKMHGSGNHFVLMDNREARIVRESMAEAAVKICRDGFAVGADGLILLDTAPEGSGCDYIWHFYNNDGSRAEMCGNGSRCAARLAYELGLAGAEHVFGTDAGPIRAKVDADTGLVKVQLTDPLDLTPDLELKAAGQKWKVDFVNTGVPHAVVPCPDAGSVDVAEAGRALRFHDQFAPAGANVNFIEIQAPDKMLVRTYERGVEAETYACGTGAVASVFTAHKKGLCGPRVRCTTSGGERLTVSVENGSVFLEGQAVLAYEGRMYLESLGL